MPKIEFREPLKGINSDRSRRRQKEPRAALAQEPVDIHEGHARLDIDDTDALVKAEDVAMMAQIEHELARGHALPPPKADILSLADGRDRQPEAAGEASDRRQLIPQTRRSSG
jgi:hypothetical protein